MFSTHMILHIFSLRLHLWIFSSILPCKVPQRSTGDNPNKSMIVRSLISTQNRCTKMLKILGFLSILSVFNIWTILNDIFASITFLMWIEINLYEETERNFELFGGNIFQSKYWACRFNPIYRETAKTVTRKMVFPWINSKTKWFSQKWLIRNFRTAVPDMSNNYILANRATKNHTFFYKMNTSANVNPKKDKCYIKYILCSIYDWIFRGVHVGAGLQFHRFMCTNT